MKKIMKMMKVKLLIQAKRMKMKKGIRWKIIHKAQLHSFLKTIKEKVQCRIVSNTVYSTCMEKMREMQEDSRIISKIEKESKAKEEEVIDSKISSIVLQELLFRTLNQETVEVDSKDQISSIQPFLELSNYRSTKFLQQLHPQVKWLTI